MSANSVLVNRNLNTTVREDEYSCDKNGEVRLKLAKEGGRVRMIGRIFEDHEGVAYHKMVYPKHLFRKEDAWGVNHVVLKLVANVGGRVIYTAPDVEYTIPAAAGLVLGKPKNYSRTGHAELQWLIPRKHWVKVPRVIGTRGMAERSLHILEQTDMERQEDPIE